VVCSTGPGKQSKTPRPFSKRWWSIRSTPLSETPQAKDGAAAAYADAEKHADTPVLGSLLKANAWFADQSGQFSTGIAGGAVTLGTGLLAAATNPVDTGVGVLKVASEAVNLTNPLFYATAGSKYATTGDSASFNPLAEGTALGGAWDAVSKPYARAIDEGRYSEAGGRLFFDAVSMLIGTGEANAAAKGSKVAPVVNTGAKVDVLAKTLPAGADLARTARPGADLVETVPGRPMPTMVLPGTSPFSVAGARQYLKFEQWFDDFYRPQKVKPVPSVPTAVGLDDVAAAAQARQPIVTHLSESFHQNIWESTGGQGKAPPAFRNKDVLFVDYERLPAAQRQAVDAAKEVTTPGAW